MPSNPILMKFLPHLHSIHLSDFGMSSSRVSDQSIPSLLEYLIYHRSRSLLSLALNSNSFKLDGLRALASGLDKHNFSLEKIELFPPFDDSDGEEEETLTAEYARAENVCLENIDRVTRRNVRLSRNIRSA